MKLKSRRGFTLVEMMVALSLLAVISAGIFISIYSGMQHYRTNKRIQEDEYNARFALLFITREAHKGVDVENVEIEPDENDNSVLTMPMLYGNTSITYSLDSNNMLSREVIGDDAVIPFKQVELESFEAEIVDGRRLRLTLMCRHGLDLETTVSLSRVPQITQP